MLDSKPASSPDLAQTVKLAMLKTAKHFISDADPGEIISDKDLDLLAEKVINLLSIEHRMKLYADVFLFEVENAAKEAGKNAVESKLKKAVKRSLI